MVLYSSTVLHLSNKAASDLLIFMLVANFPGRFVPALISDRRLGPLNTIIPCALLSSAVMWIWAGCEPNRTSLTVIACVYGFVSAGVQVSRFSSSASTAHTDIEQVLYISIVYSFCSEPEDEIAEIEMATEGCVRRPMKNKLRIGRIGMRAGGLYTCIGLACLIGTPIGGALISYRTDRGLSRPYLGAQVFAGMCLLLGSFLLLASRVLKVGWKVKRV